MNRCYIVAASDFAKAKFDAVSDDFIIAADAGLKYLDEMGITPNLIMGDFDSLGGIPERENVIIYPSQKDDTDTMLCVKKGLELGFTDFRIFGACGGRIDHTISNIQVLTYIVNHGGFGIMVGVDESICVIRNQCITFDSRAFGNMSLLCLGDKVTGIYLDGFFYPLNNATITNDFPIGVSNKFTGVPAKITVGNGTCAVIFTCDVDFLNPLV